MDITFLSADQPLTKTFARDAQGHLLKGSYPNVLHFTSHTESVSTLKDFHRALLTHAKRHHCLLKGVLQRPLVNERRAGSTDPTTPTEWICLDIDGLPGMANVEDFIKLLPKAFHEVDYLVQYSASMGVDPGKGLSAHVFFLLREPQRPELLKHWLKHINFTTEVLHEALTLTASGLALRWPLDVSVCQNDKLIYIAPPVLSQGVKDQFRGQRIQLVTKRERLLAPDFSEVVPAQNNEEQRLTINELRSTAGLKTKQMRTRLIGNAEVATNPDPIRSWESKEDRGFVYFNFNDGDSWAYFHPADNPEVIYNFKGEPNYLTKILLPDYFESIAAKFRESGEIYDPTNKRHYLAFLDVNSDTYYRGYYDETADTAELRPTNAVRKIEDFLKQHGQPLGDFIPEWTYQFRPDLDVVFNPEERFINMFQRSPYLRETPRKVTKVPATIHKIIWSVVGSDPETYDHFLNWLAVIVQQRTRTQTGWVFTGTQGTGKGVLFHQILAPLLGREYTAVRNLAELDDKFNAYMENCLLLMIDEAQISKMGNPEKITQRLLNIMVEPEISVRRMHAGHYMARNYINLIFASNKPDPVVIDPEDRRFNVGVYQKDRLFLNDEEWDNIPKELSAFASFLRTYKADIQKARTPLYNQQREDLIELSQNSLDVVATAILKGDLDKFIEDLPTDTMIEELDQYSAAKQMIYRRVLDECFEAVAASEGRMSLSRDQLYVLFNYTIGGMPDSPKKFTSLLKHHRIYVKVIRKGDKVIRGIQVKWKVSNDNLAQWRRDKAAQKGNARLRIIK